MSTMTITRPMPVRRPTRPARPAPVRLTRRGRLVVFATGLLAVLVLGMVWGAGSVASEQRGEPATQVVQVQPGDTLFGLAADATTDGDVNATIHQIQRLNGLESGVIQVGDRLRVPVG
ncbi:LysM peptidoglycan-binding domain-containing protein [Nocardioides coralli]|uniref:LysM peptidoglycan-binding domain-containing protein n=1 Tax=Nocardioides coralli TaxID=2872154 RepID=UPI001CA3BF89|nr:LysM peptidoglycan-binding domain-containing protein [Nocardioides coralli]QZY29673.1 LysM peptidoglycan-binding domain-containing protein [Nocardioides coralli]